MKEKKVVREERNKEKLTSGDWVMAEFYSIHSLKSSRMHAVIDEFKKLMGGKVEVVQVNVDEEKKNTCRILYHRAYSYLYILKKRRAVVAADRRIGIGQIGKSSKGIHGLNRVGMC